VKFKLDENFGTRTLGVFRSHGHDAQTVAAEGLQGCADQRLYDICCVERRCLVTLDLDFGDVIRFPPAASNGVVVIRVPRNPSAALLEQLVQQFLDHLSKMAVDGSLWIVELGRIRIHESEDKD
jgi:predicted nuclease of predicted toxin-antitoxin system